MIEEEADVRLESLERWMESSPLDRPLTRRELLRWTGRGALGASAAALLAACAGGKASGPGASSSPGASVTLPSFANEVSIAQWPLYIDRARGGHRPTLEAYEQRYDSDVNYRELINDNQEFFAKLYPQLNAGQSTGWDVVCLADWVISRMSKVGFTEPLHWDALPTATKNMLPAFKDPVYDPQNAHSVPWQGGVTGIAYYPDLVGGTIESFSDLWNPKLAGHVGMLTEMVDVMTLTLLMLGVDPQQATIDDATRAKDKLIEQRDAGIVRDYYGQDYVQALVDKDTWASMAWSGDVFYWKYLGGAPDLEFVVPETGGVIWASADFIPIGAEHPADAHRFMDFFYEPDIAVQVTDWVLYMTPVAGVQDLMKQKAENSKGGTKAYYETLSSSPLLFPPDDPATANLFEYKNFSEDELQQYFDLFNQVTQS
jgi:spermidine/putrescine transport system substrate-binding protein